MRSVVEVVLLLAFGWLSLIESEYEILVETPLPVGTQREHACRALLDLGAWQHWSRTFRCKSKCDARPGDTLELSLYCERDGEWCDVPLQEIVSVREKCVVGWKGCDAESGCVSVPLSPEAMRSPTVRFASTSLDWDRRLAIEDDGASRLVLVQTEKQTGRLASFVKWTNGARVAGWFESLGDEFAAQFEPSP